MRSLLGVFTIALFTASGFGQSITIAPPVHSRHLIALRDNGKNDERDPGYTLYKSGYNQILEEKWEDARKTFTQLQDKFPKSDYLDDAAYWTAYATKFFDTKKAAKAYRTFIERYPKSSYYDDAIADLAELEARLELDGIAPRALKLPPDAEADLPAPPAPRAQAFAFENMQRDLERQMRRMDRRIRILPRTLRGFHYRLDMSPKNDLDPETKLKMEALYAIGESHHDKEAFSTLKAVALDRGKHVALRAAALDALCDFTNFDVLPIVLEVARNDTSARLQQDAIAFIDRVSKDKGKSVTALIDLYNSLPPDRKSQRESIFYAIADIGQDKSVDFLANVARSSKDYDLRMAAVYYLGNIGSDRSRKALFEILREK